MTARHSILTSILTRMRTITVANGFNSNIGNTVEYWATDLTEYGVAAATLRDSSEETISVNNFHENSLSVELEAIAYSNSPLLDGCLLLADLIRAVGIDPTWGKTAIKTTLVSNEKLIETGGKTAVRVILNLAILYRTPLFNP